MDLFIAFTIFYLKIAFIWKTMKIPLCTFIRNTVRTDSMIEIPLCTFIQDCTIIRDTRVALKMVAIVFLYSKSKTLRAQIRKMSGALSALPFLRAPLALALPSFLKSAARARAPTFESAARSAALFERRSAIV